MHTEISAILWKNLLSLLWEWEREYHCYITKPFTSTVEHIKPTKMS